MACCRDWSSCRIHCKGWSSHRVCHKGWSSHRVRCRNWNNHRSHHSAWSSHRSCSSSENSHRAHLPGPSTLHTAVICASLELPWRQHTFSRYFSGFEQCFFVQEKDNLSPAPRKRKQFKIIIYSKSCGSMKCFWKISLCYCWMLVRHTSQKCWNALSSVFWHNERLYSYLRIQGILPDKTHGWAEVCHWFTCTKSSLMPWIGASVMQMLNRTEVYYPMIHHFVV